MDSVVFCFAFADAVCPLRNRAAIILRLTNAWAAQADALIADRICAGDGCLQTRATRRQRVELRFYAFLFDLQLATSLRTQVFRVLPMPARAHSMFSGWSSSASCCRCICNSVCLACISTNCACRLAALLAALLGNDWDRKKTTNDQS